MHETTLELLAALRAGDLIPSPLEAWRAAGCPDAPNFPKWSATLPDGRARIFEARDLLTATRHAVEQWPGTVSVQRVEQ